MNLKLVYTEARSDGIFGWILPIDEPADGEAKPLCVFVTHAYREPDGSYRPKVRAGIYECVRGRHSLLKNGEPVWFDTFEVTGVPGHHGILFHSGNYGENSKGCFCVGRKIVDTEDRDGVDGPDEMVTESRTSFAMFMAAQVGVDRFQLTVEEQYSV